MAFDAPGSGLIMMMMIMMMKRDDSIFRIYVSILEMISEAIIIFKIHMEFGLYMAKCMRELQIQDPG
jgi:hypothetical protein